MKKVLFVCSGNIDRSPTAEALLKGREGFDVKSAGTWPSAPTFISKELIDWADVIFVMENHHREALLRIDPTSDQKIKVLDIGDRYLRDDPELVRLLREKLSRFINNI